MDNRLEDIADRLWSIWLPCWRVSRTAALLQDGPREGVFCAVHTMSGLSDGPSKEM